MCQGGRGTGGTCLYVHLIWCFFLFFLTIVFVLCFVLFCFIELLCEHFVDLCYISSFCEVSPPTCATNKVISLPQC